MSRVRRLVRLRRLRALLADTTAHPLLPGRAMQPESSVLTPFPAARLQAIAASLAGDPDFVALIHLDPAYPHEYALELVADISARLRRACSHFADDDYAAMILNVSSSRWCRSAPT